MPVEENSEEINSPKKTRGEKPAIKAELISPTETTKHTPGRRITRRTSQLEDNTETLEEVPPSPVPTRRSTRTRKNTFDESYDMSTRRNTRRGSTANESEATPRVGTPQRITRRSASIQSEDGNTPQPVQKAPTEATIEEEDAPISRRTRASSVTSDDGANVGTPRKRGRKSLASNVAKTLEPAIEETEENQSPARPVTRSMSQSPASIEKSSPLKTKSPKNATETEINASKETENHDETIAVIAKQISEKLSNGTPDSPDILKSPASTTKTPPPKNDKKNDVKTPETSGNDRNTPKKTSSEKNTPKQTTPSTKLLSPATPKSNSTKKINKNISQTPQPIKPETEKSVFSKSWSQPVYGKASSTPKIDNFGIKKIQVTSVVNVNARTIVEDSDSSSSEEVNLDLIDDEAEVAKNYETDDSKDEEEKEILREDRMHEELGEDIGSEDSASDEEDEYENDSFIASEEDHELLSYSDDDEGIETTTDDKKHEKLEKLMKRKSAPPRVMISSDESEEDETPVVVQKSQSEKKLPKITLQTRISTGDPDISCKPMETTIFNASGVANVTSHANVTVRGLNDQTIQEESEPMEVSPAKKSPKYALKSKSPAKKDADESEFEFPEPTVAQLVAAESSLLNLSRKTSSGPSVSKNKSLSESSFNPSVSHDDPVEIVDETEVSENDQMQTTVNKSVKHNDENAKNSSEQQEEIDEIDVAAPVVESESAKRKRKRESVTNDQRPVKKSKLNVSLVSDEKLDTILEKCNEILKTKKEEKKKNKLMHKKEKEEKKKRKELLKKKEEEEAQDENGETKNDESPKKKKKKQKTGRKYNQEVGEVNADKKEEILQALKHSQEMLDKKRERKRLKKLAKLEKAKAEGVEIAKKPKINGNQVSEKKKSDPEKVEPKKKTLLTAFEVKQRLFQDETPEKSKSGDKENTENGISKKSKKKQKKTKILEPIHESNHSEASNSPTSPAPKKRMLGILSSKGSLNPRGFVVDPVTPEADRLKRNRGFVEEPMTPKPIGFKVQSMMPSGQEFVKKANKKRKRHEMDIPEPSRLPPKPIWTASGAFEEIDAPETSDYLPLNAGTRAATQFHVSVLGKKNAKKSENVASQGLSSFKMKALYKDKSRMRESSKDLARKLEKQKIYKGFKA